MQLVVLGMHRSGTSAVSRMLNLMGCYFGPECLAMSATEENPRGFWERRDVYALNESLLDAAGAAWHSPLGFDPLAIPEEKARRFHDGVRGVLCELNDHRPWFIKDPRLCVMLPAWGPLLDTPLAVHVLRHPLEVAASLQARNALPIPVGLALWEVHIRLALAGAAKWPRVTVFHRQLITDAVPTIVKLYTHLEALGVTGLRIPQEHEITDFVTPSLYRHRADRDDLVPWADAPQVHLFHLLEADIGGLDGGPCVLTVETVRTLLAHDAARGDVAAKARAAGANQ